jgi:uncharacterized protein (DUF1697 family)
VPTCIALLRGINVGGHNKISMSDLRALCTAIGWRDVETYIQSGNVVFRTSAAAASCEKKLEAAIANELDLDIAVVVRNAAQWSAYVHSNPFAKESDIEAGFVMLALAKRALNADAAQRLQERATLAERIMQRSEALWLHYPEGAGRSKLTPALFDKFAGSPVTARNWRTVLKLEEMASAADS